VYPEDQQSLSGETVMRKLEYQLSFTTPAFSGNTDQQGQWRTPPFEGVNNE
jgi:hypothetical protein